MTGREFLIFMIGVLVCHMLRAFRESSQVDGAKPGPAAEERERSNAPQGRPFVQVPIWPFCLLGAGWLSMVEFYALNRLFSGMIDGIPACTSSSGAWPRARPCWV